MAGSVNKVILVGNLGRDPEVRSFANGGKVVKFSLATSETWKDRDGDRKEKTEWHNVVIYDEKIAEVAEKHLAKGSKVYLEGQLQTREYEGADGAKQRTTEVVLQRFRGSLVMLDKAEAGSRGSGGPDTQEQRPAFERDLDDQVPFAGTEARGRVF